MSINNNTSVIPVQSQLLVDVEDVSVLRAIKSAIKQLKGVAAVKEVKPKTKMSKDEFLAKIENAKNEANDPTKCYTQMQNESVEDFLNRMLCTPSAL